MLIFQVHQGSECEAAGAISDCEVVVGFHSGLSPGNSFIFVLFFVCFFTRYVTTETCCFLVHCKTIHDSHDSKRLAHV